MGEFRFRIPEFWEFTTRHARTVHIIGLDGSPRPCNVTRDGNTLQIRRNQNESGRTYVSYPFSQHGELVICTGTLPESEIVYDLATELARGTINRLRNQTSIWEEGGLEIPAQVKQLTKMATTKLGDSIVAEANSKGGSTSKNVAKLKDEFAREALEYAIQAIFQLSRKFGNDISQFRVSQLEIPSFWIATSQPTCPIQDDKIVERFDLFTTFPGVDDKHARLKSQKQIAGPILDASPFSSFSQDFPDFQSGRENLLSRCDQLIDSLDENVAMIHAACGLNGIGHKNLNYRQQIQLTNDLLNKIDNTNRNIPVLLSFDYPWAERLAWSVGGIHPIQIAEDAMRNGSRISFIGLDINLDYWPNGSISRDPLQWIDLVDVWCQIGLPLVLCFRVPQPIQIEELITDNSDFLPNHDENVTIAIDRELPEEDKPADKTPAIGNSIRENLNDCQRLDLIRTLLPMMVARPGVHGIIWRQWQDKDDPRFPLAGLFNEVGIAKRTVHCIDELRKKTLQR